MFADEIRRAVTAAPRMALPEVAAVMWRAYSAGQISEAEAEELSELIEAHKIVPAEVPPTRTSVGSRPRTDGSLERRRRWATSGRLPPALASKFTMAEIAVLSVIAAETHERSDCRLAIGHLAAVAGVSETTVRNAVRHARAYGLIAVQERPLTAWRNDTNIVSVISPEWLSWLRLSKRRQRSAAPSRSERETLRLGGGCKSVNRTPTGRSNPVNSGHWKRRRAAGRQGGGPTNATSARS